MPSWLHTFDSACLSGRCCSPGTASCLADSQRLIGYLVYPKGLPVQLDPSSIPSYSFHGAHMECTTHILTAVAVNLIRLLARWEECPKAQTRHARFTAVWQATA